MNNELVEIIDGNVVVSSRQIAENFGKRHKDVLRAIRSLGCTEEFTERNFAPSHYIDASGKGNIEYFMTRDGFTFLAMGFTGSAAAQWKERYIEAFNAMEKAMTAPQLPDFTNPVLAARAWADEVELKQLAEATVKTLTPKAEYYDDLVERNHLTSLRETAKELRIPERKFVAHLVNNGYLYRDKHSKLQPMAKYVPTLFQIKDFTANTGHTGTHTLFTPKAKEIFGQLREALA